MATEPNPQDLPARFSCATCSKTFTRAAILRDHIRSHTGEKPFKCTFCSVAFARNNDRRQHEKEKHAGTIVRFRCEDWESPGVCRYKGCEATFHRKSSLLRHRAGVSHTVLSVIFEDDMDELDQTISGASIIQSLIDDQTRNDHRNYNDRMLLAEVLEKAPPTFRAEATSLNGIDKSD